MSEKRYPLIPTGKGSEVVQTGPDACPNGHRFGPNRVFCSWLPCLCAPPEVGHSTWKCRTCGTIIYDPTARREAAADRGVALRRAVTMRPRGRLERGDGYPPHPERYEAVGIDLLHALGQRAELRAAVGER